MKKISEGIFMYGNSYLLSFNLHKVTFGNESSCENKNKTCFAKNCVSKFNDIQQKNIYQGPSIEDVGIFKGVGGSEIPMLQEIRRQKLGKSGSKFRHGEGGYQGRPKNSDVFYGRPLDENVQLSKTYSIQAVNHSAFIYQATPPYSLYSNR